MTTIMQTRAFYEALARSCEADVEQIELALADLAAMELDEATLDGFQSAQDDARRAAQRARRTVAVLDERQGLLEQAVNATPDAARVEFYRDGAGGVHDPRGGQAPPAPQEEPAMSDDRDKPRVETSVKDPLRVAGRMTLHHGERFAGSGSVADHEGMMVLAAAVDGPAGRQVHVGVPIHEEDKKEWRGAHAPAQLTEVDDEDGEEYSTDTGSDTTVILDAADAARLPEVAEEVIGRATAADKEFRQVAKECDRLYDERARLEAQRFPGRGEEKIAVDAKVDSEEKLQARRRRDVDRAAEHLDPADRAAYDERQRTIDAAGRDGWEPDREAEAAEVCGLAVDEFREIRDLERIPYRQRTAAQEERLDQLAHGGGDVLHPVLPPLLAQQAALVCGLTLDEFREMEALERIPRRSRQEYYNRGRRVRTDAEQTRLDELEASTRGATGANRRDTDNLRGQYLSMLRVHHSAKTTLAQARTEQAAMEATAQPLDAATAAELDRVVVAHDAASEQYDARAGWASATAEIPARNGGALVIEAIQEEEGGVRYKVDRKPADADEDWSAGTIGEPFTVTAGGLRKAAKLVGDLSGSSDPKPSPPAPRNAAALAAQDTAPGAATLLPTRAPVAVGHAEHHSHGPADTDTAHRRR